jgi:hypothetical protein
MLSREEFRVKCARPALGIDWLHEKYDEALNNFRMWRAKPTPEEEAAKERAFKEKEKWRNLIEEKRRRVEIERLELEIRERDRELEHKRKREEDALRLRRELELDRAAMRRGDEGGINLDVKPTSEAKDLSDIRKKVMELPR